MHIRNFEDIWFDILEEEFEKTGNRIRINKETDPILYKISQIIEAKMAHDIGIINKESEELYKRYYIIEK